MTTSNLDLARECGFSVGATWGYFTNNKLDAFAERIRADAMAEYAAMTEKGAKAWADVPGATAWVDELRGSEPQAAGNAMSINYMDEFGKLWRYCSKCHAHSPTEIGCAHFAAAPVAVERKPLTDEQRQAVIDAMPAYDDWGRRDKNGDVNLHDLARAIEAAHGIVGITAQQGGEP